MTGARTEACECRHRPNVTVVRNGCLGCWCHQGNEVLRLPLIDGVHRLPRVETRGQRVFGVDPGGPLGYFSFVSGIRRPDGSILINRLWDGTP